MRYIQPQTPSKHHVPVCRIAYVRNGALRREICDNRNSPRAVGEKCTQGRTDDLALDALGAIFWACFVSLSVGVCTVWVYRRGVGKGKKVLPCYPLYRTHHMAG